MKNLLIADVACKRFGDLALGEVFTSQYWSGFSIVAQITGVRGFISRDNKVFRFRAYDADNEVIHYGASELRVSLMMHPQREVHTRRFSEGVLAVTNEGLYISACYEPRGAFNEEYWFSMRSWQMDAGPNNHRASFVDRWQLNARFSKELARDDSVTILEAGFGESE